MQKMTRNAMKMPDNSTLTEDVNTYFNAYFYF